MEIDINLQKDIDHANFIRVNWLDSGAEFAKQWNRIGKK